MVRDASNGGFFDGCQVPAIVNKHPEGVSIIRSGWGECHSLL